MSALTQNIRTALKFVAVIVILIVINMAASQTNIQWDMTEARIFSLSDQSTQIARSVDTSVKFLFFHTPQMQSKTQPERIRRLLKQYKRLNDQISMEEIDHTRNPNLARKHQIQGNNVVLIKADDRTKKLSSYDMFEFAGRRGQNRKFRGEKAITTALMKLTQSTDRGVYFTTGHGEYKTSKARNRSISNWTDALEKEGYTVKTINPLREDLPDTRELLVVVEPQKDFSSKLLKILKRWHRKGGNLLLAAGPPYGSTFNSLLDETGISFDENQILDEQRRIRTLQSLVNPFIFAPKIETHPITSDIKEQGLAVQVGRSSSLNVSSDTADKLLTTSSEAFSKPLTPAGKRLNANFNPETDEKGPFPVAIAFDGPGPSGKIIAISNAQVFGNSYLKQAPGNKNFALNTVGWIFDRQISLTIRSTPTDYNKVTVTNQQALIIQITALGIIPGFILLWGGLVWWKRKNR